MDTSNNVGERKRKQKRIRKKKHESIITTANTATTPSDLIMKNDKFEVKIISTDDNETKKVKITPPNLLLAYLYHLNAEHTKYITSGFHSKTLAPCLIVCDVGNSFIELNEMEYSSIFLKCDKINNYFNTYVSRETCNQIVYDPEYLSLQYTDIQFILINNVKHVTIQITGNTDFNNRMTLNDREWGVFSELFGFFNQLLYWHKSISAAVTTYYNHYLKLCADRNQIYLDQQEFFSLNDVINSNISNSSSNSNDHPFGALSLYQQSNFNYFRLFQEIGFQCTENITIQILKKIYSSK